MVVLWEKEKSQDYAVTSRAVPLGRWSCINLRCRTVGGSPDFDCGYFKLFLTFGHSGCSRLIYESAVQGRILEEII